MKQQQYLVSLVLYVKRTIDSHSCCRKSLTEIGGLAAFAARLHSADKADIIYVSKSLFRAGLNDFVSQA